MTDEQLNLNEQQQKVEIQTMSALLSRLDWMQKLGYTFDGDRDIYTALGWNKNPTVESYWLKYDRQDIARRIINAPVNTTWRGNVDLTKVKESTSATGDNKFEREWKELEKRLRLTNYFSRVDKLCRIGHYAVLLLGFDDVENDGDFRKPVGQTEVPPATEPLDIDFDSPPSGIGKSLSLLYVKTFSEANTTVHKWNGNPRSPRYWLPEEYSIRVHRADGGASKTYYVHHTRVVHVVEDVLENDTFGVPAMRAVLNRLDDLEKLVGGSAEMFWRGARPGYAAITDKDTHMGPQDKEDFQEQAKQWTHDLTRFLRLKGIDIKELAPQVSSPQEHVNVQLQMISAVSGIPIRILIGSERGELASTQDDDNYFTRINERRTDHAEPNIVHPTVARLIYYGVLSDPGEFNVEWEDLWAPSDKDKSTVAKTYSEALAQYFKANMEDRLPLETFLYEVMQWEEEQVNSVVEYAKKMQDEEQLEIDADLRAVRENQAIEGEGDE